MNNHVYPRIHYPEVYILEGGYCQYFKQSADRCEPPSYVTMDDPSHATSRREDLDQFRKARFGRTKSYAYGDGAVKANMMSQQSQQQQKRNTAPNSLFAAATVAHTRRAGAGPLTTLAEDGNNAPPSDGDETDDLGDSPCPPPSKTSAFKGKKVGRVLARAETYGPASMAY
jgi:M-phase inducer tyrosine phosphatase